MERITTGDLEAQKLDSTYVNKDDLILAAGSIDAAKYLIQELSDDYFSLDCKNEKDQITILYEYERARAKTGILVDLIHNMVVDFEKAGITAY